MNDLDPHLEILMQDFVRLCPDDAPLEQDDWAGLQEICGFIHKQDIQCTAATFGEYLLHQGVSPHKATVITAQYDRCLQQLTAGDQRPHAQGPVAP